MRQEKIILSLVVLVIILSIFLFTGIGYAVETDNLLIVNQSNSIINQTGFEIAFAKETRYIGNGTAELRVIGPTTATINITNLKNIGDYVTAIFTIENTSGDISAELEAKVTNTNTEYFNVTSTLSDAVIESKTGKVTLEVTVELIKLPVEGEEKTDISASIIATPKY